MSEELPCNHKYGKLSMAEFKGRTIQGLIDIKADIKEMKKHREKDLERIRKLESDSNFAKGIAAAIGFISGLFGSYLRK